MNKLKVFLASLTGFWLVTIAAAGTTQAQITPAPTPVCAPSTKALCVAGQALDLFSDQQTCEEFVCLVGRGFEESPTNSTWYSQTPQQFSNKVFGGNPDEVFGERYTYAQINWIFNSLITMINPAPGAQSPADIVNFLKVINDLMAQAPSTPPSIADYGRLGPLGLVAGGIDYLYSHPIASGINETKKLASIFDPASSAQAQGVGFDKLGQGNIQVLWKATRNISYLIIVILLIASGFMVMFRSRISPQAVVTVQMIIPKLVVSIILIAFSYAIVGFVIDLAYVAIVVVLGALNIANPDFYQANGFANAVSIMTGDFRFVVTFLGGYIFWALIIFVIAIVILPIILSLYPGALGIVAMGLGAMLFGIFAWSLYVWVRIFGQLLLAYLNIALLTIAGPLSIMMDVLPGDGKRSVGFTPWIRCVIGNASVFVAYAVIAIVAQSLFGLGRGLTGIDIGFNLDTTKLNLQYDLPLGDFSGLAFGFLLQMAFFTAVPNIVAGIRDMFCKGEDYSKFAENFVKDTVGQLTKAGQSAGEKAAAGSKETGNNAVPTAPDASVAPTAGVQGVGGGGGGTGAAG